MTAIIPIKAGKDLTTVLKLLEEYQDELMAMIDAFAVGEKVKALELREIHKNKK